MTALAGARVLVTGASGFVGRHLVAALVGAGAEVHGTSRSTQAPLQGVRWWRCDVADGAAVAALFAELRPDHVCHLSSLADGRRERALVLPTLQSETVAAVNILDAATGAGTRRVILPASIEEPGADGVPLSPYGAAKTATHLYAKMYHRLYESPVVMARIFMAYGPGQPSWKILPATVARLLRQEAPVIDSPDRAVDWIYIADVVAGLLAVLSASDVDGEVVDVGSGELVTIRAIVERLRRLVGTDVQPSYGSAQARGDAGVRRADVARAQALTGWRPTVSLDEGLQRTVNALRAGRKG